MKDTNKVVLIGRLTRDAELAYTQGGTPYLKMGVAVNESKKDGDSYKDYANFFDVVLWGKLGETLKQYATKGKQIAVTGSLHQDRWEKDGRNNSRVTINADDLQLLGGKSDGQQASAPKVDENGFPEDVPF